MSRRYLLLYTLGLFATLSLIFYMTTVFWVALTSRGYAFIVTGSNIHVYIIGLFVFTPTAFLWCIRDIIKYFRMLLSALEEDIEIS